MNSLRRFSLGLAMVLLASFVKSTASEAIKPPEIKSIARPAAGNTEIIFRSPSGPFRIQMRNSLEANAPWTDVSNAVITELQPGVYMGLFPNGKDDLRFYRVVSQADGVSDLKGWTVLLDVSPPANGSFFVKGESATVTVTILDTFAQGISREDMGTLNLYMSGPENPSQTKAAVKLLNASIDRSKNPHHYIDLKTNPNAQVNGNVITYKLQPVTEEQPGTYTVSIWSVLASDGIQQIMKFSDVQIGTAQVESSIVSMAKCASCHQGSISGKMYMHHIDVGRSPVGNWALDHEPVRSCKACHNTDGYAAYNDSSVAGGKVSDTVMRRVHGVHMGEELKLPFNTNSVNGDFKDYTKVVFPADLRNCTKCHVDQKEQWNQAVSIAACGSCHDNVWFGAKTALPQGQIAHSGGPQANDNRCIACHNGEGIIASVEESHAIKPPSIDAIDISLSTPVNGSYYVAGEAPVVKLVFKDDNGNPIEDHTKVTDVNFSTASLFVYGPRSHTVPVLTSTAKYVSEKLRASVSSSKAGPWNINGKIFKIAINGSAPMDIPIIASGGAQATAADVVNSLNTVITNVNGGAKATVSGTGVNIKTLIQGSKARIEIYDGEVTTAMGWKRAPNTILEPDVTVAAGSTPSNDLRALSDPLDFSDPMVTRTKTNIMYQLSDVAGLTPGTYGIYAYHIVKTGKVANLTKATGLGQLNFQVGTKTAEKKVATNCTDCHGDTIFHLYEGPVHASTFDPDYCKACHDYGHTSIGAMFKNQGGTSLNGWSGYGAMPISRRVHGVHYAHYLDHPEEIYANATKETFGGIIFPQDIRNCTKCHAESNSWNEKPSRMTCLACHDSDQAKFHGQLMTFIGDPKDPYGTSSVETCVICHGADSEFSAAKVHRLTNPYVPPYPREKAE